MSAATAFVTAVPVFEGAQGKYYIVEGKKYSMCFPIAWAYEHHTFHLKNGDAKSGPKNCGNCDTYGSIRDVFVGYCSNCLRQYNKVQHCRGSLVAPGLPVNMLKDKDMWMQYPYMFGVMKSEIGDEEGSDLTDTGVNLEQFGDMFAAIEVEEKNNGELDRNNPLHCDD